MAKRQLWGICRVPLLTWAGLCVFLTVTCFLAYMPMGNLNLPISLGIAALKASLIGAVFMQLREKNALNRLAASVGPIWVFIMFLLIGADYFTR